jgi:hypothetical protein
MAVLVAKVKPSVCSPCEGGPPSTCPNPTKLKPFICSQWASVSSFSGTYTIKIPPLANKLRSKESNLCSPTVVIELTQHGLTAEREGQRMCHSLVSSKQA